MELFGNVAFAFICDLQVEQWMLIIICVLAGGPKKKSIKLQWDDETTKTTKIFGITLRKKNAKIVDGEECVKKNQRAGPPVQELSVNIVFKAMAMESKKPSLLEDFTNDLV